MAKRLIEDMSDTWDPAKYHDTFRDDIMALVEKKVKEGKTAEVAEVEDTRRGQVVGGDSGLVGTAQAQPEEGQAGGEARRRCR